MTTAPTIGGFLTFIRNVMGVPTSALPDADPSITFAYNFAVEIVNQTINDASALMYTAAVYNLGGDNLINYAQDQPNSTYFTDLRAKWNILKFVPGVVESSSDEGTSVGYVIQEAAKNFTFADIQNLKTPWGRTYIGIAQKYGPTIWGLT